MNDQASKMSEISVLYFGRLKEIVGKRQDRVKVEDARSASDLIEMISDLHGKSFKDFVFDSKGKPRAGLAFAVNGDTVDESQLKKIKCGSIREFVILPPISGGSK